MPYSAQQDFDTDYADPDHIQAFAAALAADENTLLPDLPSPSPHASRPSTPATSGFVGGSTRIRKVSALSDFAPVNSKVKRRRKGHHVHKHQSEWLFILFRWPLLLSIFLLISFEFGFYVLIRQLVNAKEWMSAWRGRKGMLRRRLRGAKTYEEWKAAAHDLDEYMGFHEWKEMDEDPFYDWRLVRKVRHSLKTLRRKDDARGLLGVLETCMRVNFAGIESSRLYSETYIGSKNLVEDYITELAKALEYIRRSPQLSIDEKKRFFKGVNTNYGLTALCLSGGASFGYYHFGVVKAFLEADLLPRVITGTSAGGLVAALVCTRTDSELKQLLKPELACKITACEDPFSVWFKRAWTTGARFDSVTWAKKCSWFTHGSLTFREAYMRTGRILNVSVVPADRHSPTKLLNYITAPDTVIWSALLASAAVPGILNPVVLMQKLKDGRLVPWNWGSKFKDGSLRVDIPVQGLNLYFNVTNPIVSQANPHVHLFFFGARGSAGKPVAHRKGKGKGWRGNFILSAAEQWLKLELTKNFKLIRDLELLPPLLGQDWSGVFLQRFEGNVTILPRTRLRDWFRILTDPDPPELERMLSVGQLVTWPKLHIVENRLRLERQVYLGRQAVRKAQKPTRHVNGSFKPRDGGLPATDDTPAIATAGPSDDEGETNGVGEPLFEDTDAESAFRDGASWMQKRGFPEAAPSEAATPTSPDNNNLNVPLRIPMPRRRRVDDIFDSQESQPRNAEESMDASSSATITQDITARSRVNSSGSFFERLRQQSIQGFTRPFSSMRRRGARSRSSVTSVGREDSAWSSDSDSDDFAIDDTASVNQFHPTSFNIPADSPQETGEPEPEDEFA
ncbi:unnamed protein product [Peniophora sp. CBMAI 1063]|nr:unnamed protein product [Peniophora sp. CBMAI 1063]